MMRRKGRPVLSASFTRSSGEWRVLKYLTVADDATHEAVVIEVERGISGMDVAQVMDRLA
ncbi:hypothetical protein IHE49_03545 [Rhodanobacter sp. 7MK24]|nr:hypothetical protein [Rhodanobacter sp. 7MK24]